MSPLESLALLLADLNSQVRALQAENARLRGEVRPTTDSPRPTWDAGGPTGETTA